MASDTGDMDGIELADAVESIRNQLVEAAGRATGRPVAFEVCDIQMEFALELRKEIKGGSKVKAWVVEAGADASRATGRTHKVAFTLKPRDATPYWSMAYWTWSPAPATPSPGTRSSSWPRTARSTRPGWTRRHGPGSARPSGRCSRRGTTRTYGCSPASARPLWTICPTRHTYPPRNRPAPSST